MPPVALSRRHPTHSCGGRPSHACWCSDSCVRRLIVTRGSRGSSGCRPLHRCGSVREWDALHAKRDASSSTSGSNSSREARKRGAGGTSRCAVNHGNLRRWSLSELCLLRRLNGLQLLMPQLSLLLKLHTLFLSLPLLLLRKLQFLLRKLLLKLFLLQSQFRLLLLVRERRRQWLCPHLIPFPVLPRVELEVWVHSKMHVDPRALRTFCTNTARVQNPAEIIDDPAMNYGASKGRRVGVFLVRKLEGVGATQHFVRDNVRENTALTRRGGGQVANFDIYPREREKDGFTTIQLVRTF